MNDRSTTREPGRATTGPPASAWLTYALVIAAFVIGWAVTMPHGYFWPVWPAIGWGVPLAVRTFSGRRGQR